MKLLLDTQHSPRVAEQLSADGHDVLAASADPALAILSDEELLDWATRRGRAVVTENARDFDRIARAWTAAGSHHAGIVFTAPRRFHRGSTAYPGNLVKALRTLLHNPPDDRIDWVWWL